jgi:hypothetical protein
VFENRVLRRIFGPKRDGVTGGWRKLHNEELHNLYSSPNVMTFVQEDEVGRTCGTNEEEGEVYRLLVGKRPLGGRKRWWIDNIIRDLLEIGLGVVDGIGLAQYW